MGLIKDKIEQTVKDTYQFEFIEVQKIIHGYDNKHLKLEKHTKFQHFKLPEGMTEAEAYNVLSYIYNKVSHNLAKIDDKHITKEKLIKNVQANLENFYFKTVEDCELAKRLYLVQADTDWKTRVRYSFKGDKWHNANVTKEEVSDIYANLNLDLPEIIINKEETTNCDSYTMLK